MTAFATLDPRVPNDKRKQLVAKLMQQASAPRAGAPMPGASVPATDGRSFRNATDVRRAGVQPITQAPNVLSSVLSKLGVTGRQLSNEVSPGEGLPIQIPGPIGHVGVDPREIAQGQATPMPVQAGTPGAGTIALPSGTPPTSFASSGAPEWSTPPTDVHPMGGWQQLPDGSFTAASDVPGGGVPSLIPLGNGHYYDPVMDQILGHGAVAEGQAARGR